MVAKLKNIIKKNNIDIVLPEIYVCP